MTDNNTSHARYRSLVESLAGLDGAVVAYSGGIDSTLVAVATHEALGDRMIAVLATSPLLPTTELVDAGRVAEAVGFPLQLIEHPGYSNPDVYKNEEDRCYHCKDDLADALRSIADEHGFAAVLHGENADDVECGDRPGARAAREAGILSPLAEAGFTKEDVRAVARMIGLPNADKPSTPCLATRIRTGQPLASAMLERIELVEDALKRAFGFRVLRVRVDGATARVEVGSDEVARAMANRLEIERTLLNHGFRAAHIDPRGYPVPPRR